MTDWISSARQYVQPDDLMEEKPAILADGGFLICHVCTAVVAVSGIECLCLDVGGVDYESGDFLW